MSVVKVTTHPLKYYFMDLIEDILPEEAYKKEPIPKEEKLYIQFELAGNISQRQVAMILGEAYGKKPVYHRDREWKSIYNKGYYEVAGWTVNAQPFHCELTTARFSLAELPRIMTGMEALNGKGYLPDGEISINLVSENLDMRQVLNLHVMLEARKALLEQALGLSEELRIILSSNLALSLPLGAFDLPKIEAAACLLYQMSSQAEQTNKVRMKPTETSNPRYQMRTWLLRLGFIGDEFACPRRTLLENLEGNSAFFSSTTTERRPYA